MKFIFSPFPILLLFVFLTSNCSSTQKPSNSSYEKQFSSALKKLKKGKSSSKTKSSLNTSLAKIIEQETLKMNTISGDNELLKKEQNYTIQTKLLGYLNDAKPYMDPSFMGKLEELNKTETQLREELQTSHFNSGQEQLEAALSTRDKTKSRVAFAHFEKASKYGLNTPLLDSLQKVSLDFSLVEYNLTVKMSADQKYESLVKNKLRELERLNRSFKKIHFENPNSTSIDCDIEISFDPLSIIEDLKANSRNYQKEIQTGTRAETRGDRTVEVPVMERVSGTVTTNTHIKVARWRVELNPKSNSSSCDLTGKFFQEVMETKKIKLDFNGDRRAIPQELLNYDRSELLQEREIVEEMIDRIYEKIKSNYF
jgi:hypothetical protein